MRSCAEPSCGEEFDPGTTRRRYHTKKCKKKAEHQRLDPETPTDRVIAVKGSNCSNCEYAGPGKRWAFWWEDYDRQEEEMETAMVLCAKCRPPFLRQKATEGARAAYQWDAHEHETYFIVDEG
jgi:hypothetical protein